MGNWNSTALIPKYRKVVHYSVAGHNACGVEGSTRRDKVAHAVTCKACRKYLAGDNRRDHVHPQHRELLLPCYPACQEVK